MNGIKTPSTTTLGTREKRLMPNRNMRIPKRDRSIDDGPSCPFMPQTPCLLGNSRNYPTHNYDLTFEFHTKFIYESGMAFLFSGDDDVWVFVNGALAVDLGGIHQRTEARLDLGESSGLAAGKEYNLDFFWAERHVTQSNFHIETSLDLINCTVDVQR